MTESPPAPNTENAIPHDAVIPLAGSAATAVAWRAKNQLYVTVIAKATFGFAVNAPMPRTEPQTIVRAEVHYGNDPGRSIQLTSDLAPYLARADMLFTGCAYAPDGPARSLQVRLGIFASSSPSAPSARPLLDKRLLIQDPGGFQRMPIVYERALRGADGIENPVGLADVKSGPSIVDPTKPERPAGFGPIGRFWPSRKRLLRGTPRSAIEGAIAEIPEGFDGSYFQVAPADQWIDFLRGDEWILLEGLHPTHPVFRTRLPGVRGVARIHGLSLFGVSEGQPLGLVADTLRIDGDRERCTVVCRRSFPIASWAALEAMRVVAGVEIAGEPSAWIEPGARRRPGAESSPAGVGTAARIKTTLVLPPPDVEAASGQRARSMMTFALQPEQHAALEQKTALPFQATSPAIATAPATGPRPSSKPPASMFTGTLALSPEEEDIHGPTLPFVSPPIFPPPDEPKPASKPAFLGRDESPPPEPLIEPFPPAPQVERPSVAANMSFTGPPVADASKPEPQAAPLEPEPAPAAAPIERLVETPSAPPPHSAPVSAARSTRSLPGASSSDSPWAAEPQVAPAAPSRSEPPPERLVPPTPSPALRRSLYERFDRKE